MTAVTSTPGMLGREAARLAARGIHVFPLWNVRDGICVCAEADACGSPGKHPRVRAGLRQASNDPAVVALWWQRWPDAGVGLPTEANGLAVIDVDPGKGGDDTLATLINFCDGHGCDLMATRTVRTGSGGLHLYFRDPARIVKTASKTFGAPGVDTRGRGGYVVAPPSLHASGNRYEYMPDSPLAAPWPECLTPLLELPRREPTSPAPDGLGPGRSAAVSADAGARWAAAGLAREVEALRAMTRPDSGRNAALNVAAYKTGRKLHLGLDESVAYQALVDAAAGWQGHTPREIEATVRSGLDAGKRSPHPGPTTRGATA